MLRSEKRMWPIAGVLCAVLVVGCGGSAKLAADQTAEVAKYRAAFAANVAYGDQYRQVLRGVDYLIELCRKNPEAVYEVDGEELSMVQVLVDGANTFERYEPDIAAQFDRVARTDCR